MKSLIKKIITSCLVGVMLTQSMMVAAAPYGMLAVTDNGQSTTDKMTRGDRNIVTNNISGAMNGLDANQLRANSFDLSSTSPIIWGRYVPEARKGYIQMSSIRKKGYISESVSLPENPDAATLDKFYETRVEVLGPERGTVFALKGSTSGYRGINPFTDFKTPKNAIGITDPTQYHDIEFTAFATIVGMWAQHFSTQRGYIAVGNTRVETHQWEKCKTFVCNIKNYHTEATAATKPQWFIMTSASNAIARAASSGFKVKECTKQAAVYQGSNQALKDSECIATSGVSFLSATTTSDIPKTEETTWHNHELKTGWNKLFILVVAILTSIYIGAIMDVYALEQLLLPYDGYLLGAATDAVIASATQSGALWMMGYGVATFIDLNMSGSSSSLSSNFLGKLNECTSGDTCYGIDVFQPNQGKWDPAKCLIGANGPVTTNPESSGITSGKSAPRHGCIPGTSCTVPKHACVNWLSKTIDDPKAPIAVRSFYETRSHKLEKDTLIPNEVLRIKEGGVSPKRFGGDAKRE